MYFTIIIWLVSVGVIRSPSLAQSSNAATTDMVWSADYTFLATTQLDGKVIIRNTSGEIVKTLTSKNELYTVSWSPDGKFLATGGNSADINIWDVSQEKIVQTIQAFSEGVYVLAWQPTAELLLASGFDTFRAWNTTTWEPATDSLSVTLTDMKWDHDGTKFAFSGGTVGLATIQSGKVTVTPFDRSIVTTANLSIDWSSNDTQIITSGGSEGTVHLWDATTGKQIKVLLQTDATIQNATFTNSTDTIVSAVSDKGTLYTIDLNTKQIQQTDYPGTNLLSVAWNPVEDLLALGGTSQKDSVITANSTKILSGSGVFEIIPLSQK
ncbi:MAG: hypothetical protein H0X30_11980 [Anaerolineae bacterium]|nr:hypothetical protein [Anaerolineae bacterium]